MWRGGVRERGYKRSLSYRRLVNRFMALGVVEETTRRPMPEVNAFFEKLEGLFAKEDFTKAQVVEAIKEFIPNFEHEEKGKNLDQKM